MKKFNVTIITLALALSLAACAKDGKTPDDTAATKTPDSAITATDTDAASDTETATDSAAETEEELFEVPFAGLVLKCPGDWKDKVETKDGEDGSLEFSSAGSPFFTLYNNEEHISLGVFNGETETPISVEFAEIDPANDELAAMQEGINVILEHLIADYGKKTETEAQTEPEDDSVFEIETPVATLCYPAKWQDKVAVDVGDTKVAFSAAGTPLFDIVFAETEDGFALGTYAGTPVYLVEYPVEDDELAAMQEDLNVILQYLMADENFVIASN